MAMLNKHLLIGRLGQKPELRVTTNGTKVANLSVATNRQYRDKNGNLVKAPTMWHRVVVWGPTAEACAKFLDKGREVYIEGEPENRKWTKKVQVGDKTIDVEMTSTEIRATSIQFLGRGAGAPAQAGEQGTATTEEHPFAETEGSGLEPQEVSTVLPADETPSDDPDRVF